MSLKICIGHRFIESILTDSRFLTLHYLHFVLLTSKQKGSEIWILLAYTKPLPVDSPYLSLILTDTYMDNYYECNCIVDDKYLQNIYADDIIGMWIEVTL